MRKLSTAGKSSTSGLKKTEGKKRKSPCTPYREKGKGKEIPDGDGLVSLSLRPRVRTRTRKAAMIAKWKDTIFAHTSGDPIPEVVDLAVRRFGAKKDRKIWTWYANRVGINTFLDRFFEVESCWRQGELKRPAAAFHLRLQRALPKGGLK